MRIWGLRKKHLLRKNNTKDCKKMWEGRLGNMHLQSMATGSGKKTDQLPEKNSCPTGVINKPTG
jgi:hypothetical protein